MSVDDKMEKEILQKLAYNGLIEQRRTRRWGIFFKLCYLLIFISGLLIVFGFSGPSSRMAAKRKAHTALVRLSGPISARTRANARAINAELKEAFGNVHTRGVILELNSPGGSPVQSDYIYQQIKNLRHRHPKIKLYVVCTDVCASGAYYIASAADAIYANPSSLVGSIGVLMSSFGFVDLIKKIGVTRRLFTAGNNKAAMDPFKPLETRQLTHVKEMLNAIHDIFIERVKAGRGKRLKKSSVIFSGRVWTGQEALALGLIDGMGSTDDIARTLIKEKRVVDYTRRPNPFDRLIKRLGAVMGESMVQGVVTKVNASAPNLQ